jgi:hypothetical protein
MSNYSNYQPGGHTGALSDQRPRQVGKDGVPPGYVKDPRFPEPVSVLYLAQEREAEKQRARDASQRKSQERIAREAAEYAAEQERRGKRQEALLDGTVMAHLVELEERLAKLEARGKPTRLPTKARVPETPPEAA